jgi:hypothetical protein
MMGWLDTALKVAHIAGQVLSQLPVDEKSNSAVEDDSYQPGGIEAYWDPAKTAPYIRSVSDHPIALNFVSFNQDGETPFFSSTIIPLEKRGMGFNPSKEFDFYRNGEMTVFNASPRPASNASGDDNLRYIAFGVVLVLGAVATAVAGGISIGLRRTATRSEVYIERRGSSLREVKMDLRAGSLKLKFAKDDGAHIAETLTFALPPGSDLSLGARVDGELAVDEETYLALTEPARARVEMLG